MKKRYANVYYWLKTVFFTLLLHYSCEDGWEAMVAALKTPRRSQLQDQSCVQLLTVLVTDEDRQPCCDAGNSQVSADCCNKSSSVDRRSLIRQLRRDGAEVAMVVDQEIHGNRHGSIKLLGIRETDAGRIGIDHSAGQCSFLVMCSKDLLWNKVAAVNWSPIQTIMIASTLWTIVWAWDNDFETDWHRI